MFRLFIMRRHLFYEKHSIASHTKQYPAQTGETTSREGQQSVNPIIVHKKITAQLWAVIFLAFLYQTKAVLDLLHRHYS
jgi:hypothetical protein